MKILIRVINIFILCCILLSMNVNAQQLQRNQAITAYIYNFAKNVYWQNEEAIKEFHFLIIGQDKNILDEMKSLSKTRTLRDKPIKVTSSTSVDNVNQAQLIFVTKDAEKIITELFDKIEGKNVLLISDSYSDKRIIMINIINSENGNLRFEINKANILNQNLRLMEDIILLGGTEIDVAALYREGQQSLRSLQKHTAELESNLKQLENTIAERTKEIKVQKDSLDKQLNRIQEQQNILDSQSQELVIQEKELTTQIKDIQEQQKIFDAKSKELEEQKEELRRGNEILKELKDNINRQKSEIISQAKILKEQGKTINRQQNFLYLLIIIAILAILLVFAVYKGYKNKQKLSKELETKVDERTEELRSANEQLVVELSERKRTQQALIDSENHYRYLFENNPVPLLVYELGSLKILAVNGAFISHYGYNFDEALALHLPDIYPENEKLPIAELTTKLSGYEYVGEWHHLKKDGTLISVEVHSNGLLYEGRNARIAAITDITERKRAEEATKENMLKFRTLFDVNPDAIFISDAYTQEIYDCNQEACKMNGYDREELIGQSIQILHPPEIVNTSREPEGIKSFLDELERKRFIKLESIHKRKDGTIFPIETSICSLNLGGQMFIMGIDRDITERKLAEEKLRRSEEQFRLISESVADMIVVLDLNGNRIYSNPSYEPILGSVNNLPGTNSFTEIHPEDREKIRTIFYNTIETGKGQRAEYRLIAQDGSIHYIESQGSVIRNEKGNITNVVVVSRDITSRKITEEELRQYRDNLEAMVKARTAELEIAKERAESADQLKSAFLATMSHELRTPLNSIIGFTGILMKGIAGPINDEQRKQLGMAKGSAQHLLELINDVLDISKIEAGQLVVSLKLFDVAKTLQKVTSTVQPLADKKNIKLQLDISKDIMEINSDQRRVEQIFLNLLNNAIKFTDRGSVKIECESTDKNIIARVIDTGIGIKKEDMGKLFKPFSQVDTGLTRNHEGTGLGLSISQKLIEKLGGMITVESELGIGSTFTVTLPL